MQRDNQGDAHVEEGSGVAVQLVAGQHLQSAIPDSEGHQGTDNQAAEGLLPAQNVSVLLTMRPR